MSIECDQWPDQLQTENAKKEKDAHDFAGPALRQPTFKPGESRSRQQQVHHRKCEEDDQAQGSKRGCAAPIPMAIPSSHRLATVVAGSSDP